MAISVGTYLHSRTCKHSWLTALAVVLVGTAQQWLPELIERASKLRVNQGFAKDADLGPVISPAAKERIISLITSAQEEGGKIALDGRNFQVENYPDGNWVGPTVLEATTDMRCYRYVVIHVHLNLTG